jgi:hypothetical protein
MTSFDISITNREKWLIIILREFDFLYINGYNISNIDLYDRESFVTYYSKKNKRKILINWADTNQIYVQITRINSWFRGTDSINVYEIARRNPFNKEIPLDVHDNNYGDIIKINADFIKKNLMDIIRDDKWVEI